MQRVTIQDIMKKKGKEKITALTAYDYQMASIMSETELDFILVGDSVANVVLGYDNTLPVTVDEMVHHAKAVMRGATRPLVVVDMPFLSFQLGIKDTLRNAGRIIKETGANAVKIEGGEDYADTVEALVGAGIPVMGHIGLKPQSINIYGKFSVQNRGEKGYESLLADAKAVEEAGAFAIILELVPIEAAKIVTEALSIPTIGIGAGMHADGQILVVNDMLGYDDKKYFKHSRKYFDINKAIKEALNKYINDVKTGDFPTEDESFK